MKNHVIWICTPCTAWNDQPHNQLDTYITCPSASEVILKDVFSKVAVVSTTMMITNDIFHDVTDQWNLLRWCAHVMLNPRVHFCCHIILPLLLKRLEEALRSNKIDHKNI